MYRVPGDYQEDYWYPTATPTWDKVGQYPYHSQQQQHQYYNTNQQQIPLDNTASNNGYYNDYNQPHQLYYNQYPNANGQPFYENSYSDYNAADNNYVWNSQSSHYQSTVSWNPPKTEQVIVASRKQMPIWADPVIISRILSYCSITDLKNTRLVNKLWDVESQTQLRARLAIRFIGNRKMNAYLGKMREKRDFCQRFILGSGPRISLSSQITTEFFAVFGAHVRCLDIGGCSSDAKLVSLRSLLSYNLENLEELILRIKPLGQWVENPVAGPDYSGSLLPHLPKLKKLVILMDTAATAIASDVLETKTKATQEISPDANRVNAKKNGQKLLDFLHALLSSATNLEVIQSANLNYNDGHNYSTKLSNSPILCSPSNCDVSELSDLTIDSFTVSRPHNEITEHIWSMLMNDWDISLLQMKELSLQVPMSDECVQRMATKWFHLISIDLAFESNVSTKSLQFLFSSLKDSLVQAKLNFTSLTQNSPEGTCDLLPLTEVMPRFRSLQIEGFKGNLRFLEYLPNLQELKFIRFKFIHTVLKDVEPTLKAHPSLLSFEVFEDASSHSNNRQRSVQALQQLGLLFPSLRKLRLEKLIDESLCLIYAQWPGLQELEIVQGQFTDAATTSIHPNAYKVLLREEAYERFNVEALRQGHHIGNLSKLRKLSIHSPNVSDVSLILGAMQCPNLQEICVKSHQISDTAIQRLANKPSLLRLEAAHTSKLSPAVAQYAADKLKDRKGIALINKTESNMTPFQVYEFLRQNPRPKLILSRLPEKKVRKSIDLEETVPNQEDSVEDAASPLSVPETTIIEVNDDEEMPLLLPATDPKDDETPQNSQSEYSSVASPKSNKRLAKKKNKYKKRVWPKDEKGLAATRSKRIITPKIVRDYYRIGYG